MLRQFSRGANVIEVAMRQQDLHQRDASLRHHRFDTFSIAARSTSAASRVCPHQIREQFCANAVTGIIR